MVYCILNSVKLPQADFFVRQLVQILEIGANDMQENVGMEAARKAAEEAARKAAAAAIKNTPEKAEPKKSRLQQVMAAILNPQRMRSDRLPD